MNQHGQYKDSGIQFYLNVPRQFPPVQQGKKMEVFPTKTAVSYDSARAEEVKH